MKNVSLIVASMIFLIISCAQFLRYKLGIIIQLGEKHQFPIEVSLYAGGVFLLLAVWMFIAVIVQNKQ